MKLEEYKLVFIAVGLIGVLIFASPVLATFAGFPPGEQFSELYILGPERMAENYPFNVVAGQDYKVYVGVGNHMGSSVYYVVYVKLKNQAEPFPNATVGSPSPIPALYEYKFSIADDMVWESPLVFSVVGASFSANELVMKGITLNDVAFNVDKTAAWDMNATGFYYQLFFELWAYHPDSNSVQFDNRFTSLQLNLTRTD